MTAYATYLRGSTHRQGLTLDAQRERCRAWLLAHGETSQPLEFAELASTRKVQPRRELALEALEDGQAGVLVVAKQDRLARSVADFCAVMSRISRAGAHLVILDTGIDTSTVHGRLVMHILASLAEWERETISQRTREVLHHISRPVAEGGRGVRLGRIPYGELPGEAVILREMVSLRQMGAGYAAVAHHLQAAGMLPRGGGQWRSGTVHAILRRCAVEGNAR